MMREAKTVLIVGSGAELLAWFLAFRHTINNWVFAIFTAALLALLPRIAFLNTPSRPGRDQAGDDGREATPLELIGIDREFTAADLREIDQGIGLDRGLEGLRA